MGVVCSPPNSKLEDHPLSPVQGCLSKNRVLKIISGPDRHVRDEKYVQNIGWEVRRDETTRKAEALMGV